jgi:hypothetical protein
MKSCKTGLVEWPIQLIFICGAWSWLITSDTEDDRKPVVYGKILDVNILKFMKN